MIYFILLVYKTPENEITHFSMPIWGISSSLPGRFYIKSTLPPSPLPTLPSASPPRIRSPTTFPPPLYPGMNKKHLCVPGLLFFLGFLMLNLFFLGFLMSDLFFEV